jgi:hypothetical protein
MTEAMSVEAEVVADEVVEAEVAVVAVANPIMLLVSIIPRPLRNGIPLHNRSF